MQGYEYFIHCDLTYDVWNLDHGKFEVQVKAVKN